MAESYTVTHLVSSSPWNGAQDGVTVHYDTVRLEGVELPVEVKPGRKEGGPREQPKPGDTLTLDLSPHDKFPDDKLVGRIPADANGARGGGPPRGGKSVQEREEIRRQNAMTSAVALARLYVETGKWEPSGFGWEYVSGLADKIFDWTGARS